MHKAVLLILCVLAPAPMFAVDGQILINQATVMAAGGFPYVINQPGSYKLSGNLVVASYVDGIHVEASNVTIDLNGFSITNTSAGLSSYGISGNPTFPNGITIRNGNIQGFANPIGAAGSSWTLKNLTLVFEQGGTVLLGPFGRVEHVTAANTAIVVNCPAVVAFVVAHSILELSSTAGSCALTGNSATILID